MIAQDPRPTQLERTLLAWRRTMIGVLAVAGIGGIHLITTGEPALAALCGLVALAACIPILHRQTQLARGISDPSTWQPLVVACCCVALCVAVISRFGAATWF